MAQGKSKSKQKPKKVGAVIAKENADDSKPGCIYIGHIPHGFYEDQMRDYFTQFGQVLGVRICRSKKNGNSKGYGFVKFRFAAVAKTVAETCNNYLFFNKLLKCEYKPMSEIHKDMFKSWTRKFTPKTLPRRQYNNAKSEVKQIESMKRTLSKAEKKVEKLRAAGLEIQLNDILDVPDITNFPTTPKPEQKLKRTGTETVNDDDSSIVENEEPSSKKQKKTDLSSTPSANPSVKISKKSPSSVKSTPVAPSPSPSKIKKSPKPTPTSATPTIKKSPKPTPTSATPTITKSPKPTPTSATPTITKSPKPTPKSATPTIKKSPKPTPTTPRRSKRLA